MDHSAYQFWTRALASAIGLLVLRLAWAAVLWLWERGHRRAARLRACLRESFRSYLP